MTKLDHRSLAAELESLLALGATPLAITFSDAAPEGVEPFAGTAPEPTEDGRTGTVPAGCAFWMEGVDATFSTTAEDHGNCSVGSVTHGFKTFDDVAGNSDVAALLESGWVTGEMVPQIPVITERAKFVTYGPLADTTVDPDVVFLRLNAKQAMILSDALPDLQFEGKPQCHIVPIAKEAGKVAVSVGCMLSRVRTGMPSAEMTCAIPGARLEEVVERLRTTCAIDGTVAAYASQDAARFD